MLEKILTYVLCMIWILGGAKFIKDAILDYQKKEYFGVGIDVMIIFVISFLAIVGCLDLMEVI